ncbi:MAG: hypothetical protein BroJett011_22670 [Chloroflexota bacterium]|nr:MAG: hypothetical protein BroJett011_22670 [Chloroflexota bacterium]
MENTYYLEQYTQMRQREMEEAARVERLIREAEGQQPKLWRKLIWRLGDWLIGLGHRLKYQQKAAVETLMFKLKD